MRVRNDLLKLLGLCLLAGVLVAGLLFPVVGSFGVVSNQASDTVDSVSADLVTTDLPLVTTVTDKDGAPIAYVYDQYRVLTPPDKIAPAMKAALISVEDRRFYEHHGVDWPGTLRALVTNQVNGSVSQGASTLTQQYVKNYLVHVVARNNKVEQQRAQEQTIARKLREARIAMQLESKLSKEDILARYLNTVPFGSTIYGIAAASQAYFNTTPDQLTVPQAAMLAGMVNSPSALDPERYPEKALERRNRVIDKMVENQRLAPDAGEAAKREPLGLADPVRTPPNGCVGAGPENGFFCSYVLNYLQKVGFSAEQLETGGYTIRTTLDRTATVQAKQAAEAQVPKNSNGIANTIAIVTPGTDRHNVVALAANRDYGLKPEEGQTTYDLPSGVENKFGAGSVYKIFTAASALEKGMGIENVVQTPPSYTSKVFKNNGAPYSLTNNTPNYPPSMTLQQALATSPNTGFVILEERIGMDSVVDMASRLGLRDTMASNVAGETPNPKAEDRDRRTSQTEFFKPKRGNAGNGTFTLGPAAVSTLELANVGATLMSGGKWCPPTPIAQVLDRHGQPVKINEQPCEQVVPKELADTLVIGLSKDDQGNGTSAAAAKKYEWKRPMMGKTGTTQDAKSAAFVGATPQFAGAVQTFNDGTAPRPICDSDPPKLCPKGDIYGGKVPARTWFDAMTKIHGNLPIATLPSTTERYVKGGSEIRIPNVIGKPVDAARQDLEKAGYQVVTRSQNSEKAKGIVVSQSPRGSALPGETITLYVSTGYLPPPHSDPGGGQVSGTPGTTSPSTPGSSTSPKPTTPPPASSPPIIPTRPSRPGG